MASKLKTMIVGCGSMGRHWLKVLTDCPQTEVAAVVDTRAEAARKLAESAGLPVGRAATDLQAALAQHRPDLVTDCTVPSAHRDVTVAALRAGCHVIGEKPLAETMEQAREMVAAARAAKRIYMVSQNRRWIPAVRAVREALVAKLIGTLTTVNCEFYLGAHFGGFRAEMDHPLILDMAIHHFDMMRCMTQTDPRAAYCHAFNPAGSWYKGCAAASVIFEMSGGVVFSYLGSWCAEGLGTSWEGAWRFVSDKGSITWDGRQSILAEVVPPQEGKFQRKGEVKPIAVTDPGPAGQAGTLKRFLEALEAGQQPEAWCGDNIKSLAMVCGAVESARRKERVNVEE